MDEYLSTGIKAIIDEFPRVAEVLDEYDVACGPCKVGTCLLKDVVSIHNLAPDAEKELMGRIASIISGEESAAPSPAAKKTTLSDEGIKYSPPMQRLVDEHVLIKKVVAAIPDLVEGLDPRTEEGKQLVFDVVDFVRSYADKFHHAKEEDLLFKYFDESLEVVATMLEEHEEGRRFMRNTLSGVERGDEAAVKQNLLAYHELLSEHIKKEDEILYPWMDRELSVTQIGQLASQFDEADEKFGDEPKKYKRFVEGLEELTKKREVTK